MATLVSNKKKSSNSKKIEVVDLFCGIGGLSYGMKSEGFDIRAGYDLDWTCQYAYETTKDIHIIRIKLKNTTRPMIVAV